MSVPEPAYALSGHCSVIYDNTLYVYSPSGFQSLALEEGAEWKQLPMDISLTGAQCVKAVPTGDSNSAKLWIVGGSVNETAAAWDYPGLMHYTFAQKKWDWVRPPHSAFVTQNRQNHAAVYLPEVEKLLVYSGSQTTGDAGPSSQTFLISTKEPFDVASTPSADVPPAVKPILMPWDNKSAVMLGGGPQNTAVFLFSAEGGWRNLGVTLTEPFVNQDAVQCTIVSGDDQSKVLQKFDMSVTPNKVTRIALLNQGGTVAAPGTLVGEKTKRLTIDDWPAYNGTLAPNATRTGFSIAQDEEGLTVVSGGSQEDPLCIFDQQENAWVNATELFAGQQVVVKTTSSTTSELPTSTTSNPAASSDVAPVAAPIDEKSRMLTVLGATLGAIFGIAAILILLLFCLKYRKAQKKKEQQSGYIEEDKNRLSFADRGAEFMKEAGGTVISEYPPRNGSQTSLAIVSGRYGNNHKRGLGPLGSDASTAGLVKKSSPLGYTEPVELAKFDLKPERVDEHLVRQNSGRAPPRAVAALGRCRSSGWSKYFANNDATNLATMPADRSTYASERTSTGSQSNYTDSRLHSQAVPPLHIPTFNNERVSVVVKGSPTLGHSQENLPYQNAQPMQAELGRADSTGSIRSNYSQQGYHGRTPVKSWTPVGDAERPPSSTYTNSFIGESQVRDGTSSYYGDGASSFYPKSNYSSFYPGQTPPVGGPEGRDSTFTMFPGGHGADGSSYPTSNDPPAFGLPPRLGSPQDRESTVTIFPGGVAGASSKKPADQDMSWLNLGAGK